jgi:hypothetical protein
MSEVVGLFELLDLRVHHVVISPHYRDATDNGNPAGHGRGHEKAHANM